MGRLVHEDFQGPAWKPPHFGTCGKNGCLVLVLLVMDDIAL
jgi:hypothetical protein